MPATRLRSAAEGWAARVPPVPITTSGSLKHPATSASAASSTAIAQRSR